MSTWMWRPTVFVPSTDGMSGRTPTPVKYCPMGEYVNPFFSDDERFGHNNTVFRAYRYTPDFPGLRGQPWRPEEYAWINHLYAGR